MEELSAASQASPDDVPAALLTTLALKAPSLAGAATNLQGFASRDDAPAPGVEEDSSSEESDANNVGCCACSDIFCNRRGTTRAPTADNLCNGESLLHSGSTLSTLLVVLNLKQSRARTVEPRSLECVFNCRCTLQLIYLSQRENTMKERRVLEPSRRRMMSIVTS